MKINSNIQHDTCTATGKLSTALGQNTQALGDNSLAEGNSTLVLGRNAHAEGYATLASGNNSHAEGYNTTASGLYAHAEGDNTLSSSQGSHAEGGNTTASGIYSHAEGTGTYAGNYAHSEGQYTIACEGYSTKVTSVSTSLKTLTVENIGSLAVGKNIVVSVNNATPITTTITAVSGNVITLTDTPAAASAYVTIVNGTKATHAEGYNTIAAGENSHAEGYTTRALGVSSHSEGSNTLASGNYAHAEGSSTLASGSQSHAEGYNTFATGNYSHAEGYATVASGGGSHAEGGSTVATGAYSHAGGFTTQSRYVQTVIGQYNTVSTASDTTYDASKELFIIGNGTSTSARGNAFKVLANGETYADGTYNSTGADYSEYFEWIDGNVNDEDMVGYFVTLDGEKIRKANASDTYILGITSGSPAIIGDNHEAWQGKYLSDEWGRLLYDDVIVPAEYEQVDGEQVEISPERVERRIKLNPAWNPEQTYQSRAERKEWSTVGLLGKLLVRDDGTCQVGQNCYPNADGIATHSTSGQGYRVMKRTGQNQILVFVK